MNKLRWGILGTGAIAHKFAQGVLQSQLGELAAIGSRTDAKAVDFAQQYRIPHAHSSYSAVLADPDVDVVYIATPHPHHREWTVRAAQAGKHILCEKPLGIHYDEAVEMLQAVWENKVFFMEAYMYRCHPQINRVLELIREGAIGEVRNIVARFGFLAKYDLESRLFNRTLGGGGILDVGGYCTSMARLIAGADSSMVAEPEKVFAVGEIGLESGVDEFAAALLHFPGNITATLSCGLRMNQDNRVRIEGTAGTIVLPTPWTPSLEGGETLIELQKLGQPPETIAVTAGSLYAIEADVVAQNIAQGRIEAAWPAMSWADTLGNIRVQDQWRRAMDATGPNFEALPGKTTQQLPFVTWEQRFSRLFHLAVRKYQQGHQQAAGLTDPRGQKFLASIGYTEQEFFDFIEDFAKGGEPTLDTSLRIAAVRREYFFKEQNGILSPNLISMQNLPSKDAQVEGIGWLPRLLPKAEAKLRGEMPPDLMYSCGGDRRFFREHGIDPADFLRQVWNAHGNHAAVVSWVKSVSTK